jgi:hypothetical protein
MRVPDADCDGALHIDEVDVDPIWSRQGIGALPTAERHRGMTSRGAMACRTGAGR